MDAVIAFLALITFVGAAVGYALWRETNGTETARRDDSPPSEQIPGERVAFRSSNQLIGERVTLRYAALILFIAAATGVAVSAGLSVLHITGASHSIVRHRRDLDLAFRLCMAFACLLLASYYLHAIWGRSRGGSVVLSLSSTGGAGRVIVQAVAGMVPLLNFWLWFDHTIAALITSTMLLLHAFAIYTTVANTLLREDGIWRGRYYAWRSVRGYNWFKPPRIARVSGYSQIILSVRNPLLWPLPFPWTHKVVMLVPDAQREAVERVLLEYTTAPVTDRPASAATPRAR